MKHETVPPRLSIVVSCCEAWDKLAPVCAALLPQAGEAGAEVIIAVSGPRCLPAGGVQSLPGHYEGVHALVLPGANIFELRAEGIGRARGGIVALLEDHNLVPPLWCERLIARHAAHPDCIAVVGAIRNASEATVIDQANFLFNFGAYLPKLGNGRFRRPPAIAGSSFRTGPLPPGRLGPGQVELQLFGEWYRSGRTVFDPDDVVTHVQSNPAPRTFANHFHNARACAGLKKQLQAGHGAACGLAFSLALPAYFVHRWLIGDARKVLGLGYRKTLPVLLLIGFVYAAGSALGWLRGPGRSPWLLE